MTKPSGVGLDALRQRAVTPRVQTIASLNCRRLKMVVAICQLLRKTPVSLDALERGVVAQEGYPPGPAHQVTTVTWIPYWNGSGCGC
eukprot:2752961-Amphidinium_carterae.1